MMADLFLRPCVRRYKPLFDYFAKDYPEAFRVCNDAYVTADSGTGIVHQAPAFGEDDMRVCLDHGIVIKGGDLPCPINSDGCFIEPICDPEFGSVGANSAPFSSYFMLTMIILPRQARDKCRRS